MKRTQPDSRYEVIANGAEVKDKHTGLIWQRCMIGQKWDGNTCTGVGTKYSWKAALLKAKDLNSNYRLPNIKELQSIVELACDYSFNTKAFPNTRGGGSFWSSSPKADTNQNVRIWYVDFSNGNARYSKDQNESHYVRLVRSK